MLSQLLRNLLLADPQACHDSSRTDVELTCAPYLSFISKLGQHSHQLSVGVMLLVDGELAAWLQLPLGMYHADVIDNGNLLLGICQGEGPHPVKPMPCNIEQSSPWHSWYWEMVVCSWPCAPRKDPTEPLNYIIAVLERRDNRRLLPQKSMMCC